MLRKIDWDNQIGRRLRLRDLHVFFTVVQRGSMAKAATQLGVATPTVSEVVADLEHSLGVRLFDRSPKGVALTQYGHVLYRRTIAVFDELKEGIREIERLDDPTRGEIRIACPLALASTIMPHLLAEFTKKYPDVVVHFDEVAAASAGRYLQDLRDRKFDVVLGFAWALPTEEWSADDLNIETLYNDKLVIVASARSKWASRRKIDLAEVIEEPWIVQGPHTWNYRNLAVACRARGVSMPKGRMVTLSISVIMNFLADGEFITAMPRSVAQFRSLKILPIDLPSRPWPVNMVSLKNRTLSPAAERFMQSARTFSARMQKASGGGLWRRSEIAEQ